MGLISGRLQTPMLRLAAELNVLTRRLPQIRRAERRLNEEELNKCVLCFYFGKVKAGTTGGDKS